MSLHHFLYLFIVINVLSCYTRNKACLDSLASNFDVTADDNCIDCCKYPSLRITIDQMIGDSLYKASDTLTNDLGQKYTLEDIRYYLSDFKLYQGDSIYTVREKIATEGNTLVLPNDQKILRGTDRELEIGSIRAFGRYDSLSFEMGLSAAMTDNIFVNLPSNHVLLKKFKLKNAMDETAYIALRFRRIAPFKDTISQNIYITKRPAFKTYVRDTAIISSKGASIIFPIKTDYSVLFKNLNINLSNDSLSILLFENLNNMIIVK